MPANAYKTGASDKPCAKYSSQIRHALTTFPALPKFTYSLAFFVLGGLNFTNLSSKFNGKVVLPNLPLKFNRRRRKYGSKCTDDLPKRAANLPADLAFTAYKSAAMRLKTTPMFNLATKKTSKFCPLNFDASRKSNLIV